MSAGHQAMRCKQELLSNWGNFPRIEAEVCYPTCADDVRKEVLRCERVIARGNGRCYGDASLGTHVISMLGLNRVRHFDPCQGVIEVEAGVLLDQILDYVVPAGWFFHVTPGTRFITVGGAIACDVHGKNHPQKGCFSNWLLDFELLKADGSTVRCSRQENSELFWQTCGGMGWTGIILSARIQLMRINSIWLRQRVVKAPNLEALLLAFEAHRAWPYAVAWLDGLSRGGNLGRSLLFLSEHTEGSVSESLAFPRRKAFTVPPYAPSFLLNPVTIRAYNHFRFASAQEGERLIDLEACFYPLDRLRLWNRLYGRRGFIQYQFCLPETHAAQGMNQVLTLSHQQGIVPFLCVVKRHGDRPPEAVHSFPERGYSLALDFPRTSKLFSLIQQLDEVVWQLGGKIYLAKDVCSAPKLSRIYPQHFAPDKFWSLMRERLQHADDYQKKS